METRSWKFPPEERCRDSRELPPGPWDDEVDKMQWLDEKTGLPCLIVRGPLASLCGYVGVGRDHPWYGVEYSQSCTRCEGKGKTWCDHSPDSNIGVHGGLTFSGFCRTEEGDHGICHVVEPGEEAVVWWFGFDTAHAGDLIPGMIATLTEVHKKLQLEDPAHWRDYERSETYKDIEYVKAEVARLAEQLKAMTVKEIT